MLLKCSTFHLTVRLLQPNFINTPHLECSIQLLHTGNNRCWDTCMNISLLFFHKCMQNCMQMDQFTLKLDQNNQWPIHTYSQIQFTSESASFFVMFVYNYPGGWLSIQHNIGYTGDGFYRSKDPTNSIKVLKEHIIWESCMSKRPWTYLLSTDKNSSSKIDSTQKQCDLFLCVILLAQTLRELS